MMIRIKGSEHSGIGPANSMSGGIISGLTVGTRLRVFITCFILFYY